MFQCLFLRLGIDGCTTHSVYHLTTGVCSSGRGFTLSAAIADLGDGPTRIGLSLDGRKINPGNQHTDTLLNRLSLLRRKPSWISINSALPERGVDGDVVWLWMNRCPPSTQMLRKRRREVFLVQWLHRLLCVWLLFCISVAHNKVLCLWILTPSTPELSCICGPALCHLASGWHGSWCGRTMCRLSYRGINKVMVKLSDHLNHPCVHAPLSHSLLSCLPFSLRALCKSFPLSGSGTGLWQNAMCDVVSILVGVSG